MIAFLTFTQHVVELTLPNSGTEIAMELNTTQNCVGGTEVGFAMTLFHFVDTICFSTKQFTWFLGDCLVDGYPECHTDYPELIGDGTCDAASDVLLENQRFNTTECGYDGGDCALHPEGYEDCYVAEPGRVGNGVCDGWDYNIEECGWDGGDCDWLNSNYPNCIATYISQIGDGRCDGGEFNVESCGWDGGDCFGKLNLA